MRLIDADLLKERVELEAMRNNGRVSFSILLDTMPTIPTSSSSLTVLKGFNPKVYGNWIDGTHEKEIPIYVCSWCGKKVTRDDYHYCPWCGADMRGEE